MGEIVSALFVNQAAASDAVDRLIGAGINLSEINVIVSPGWLGIACRSGASLGVIVAAASRAQTGRHIDFERHGEAFVAGPLAGTVSRGYRRDRTREELDALFDSLSTGGETLTDLLDRGAVIIAVATRVALRAGAEQALFADAAMMPAQQDAARWETPSNAYSDR